MSPSRVAWTYAKGRIAILHNVKTPANVGSSLFLTYLGRQSTRTLPGYELHPTDKRVGWDYTYRPYARAENMNPARYTQGGTGTINLQANAAGTRQVARLSSPTGQRAYWEFSPSTGGQGKLLLYAAFEVVSGPASPSNEQGFEVHLAGSSTDHHIWAPRALSYTT